MTPRVLPAQMDSVLTRFYSSSSGDAELRELVGLVRDSMRTRLAGRVSEREVLDDLYADAVARLCVATRKSRSGEAQRIDNFASYALTVADSVVEDHLRRIRPNWYRLKRRIVYLLDGRGGGAVFARWRSHPDWLGGLARWRGNPVRRTPQYSVFMEQPDRFAREALREEPSGMVLPELLVALFRWLETPVEVNTLTSQVGAVQGLQEITTVRLEGSDMAGMSGGEGNDALTVRNPAEAIVGYLATENLRYEVWRILCELPLRQRVCLLLGLERDELLLIGTVSGIGEAVGVSMDEIAGLWRGLPYSDGQIANRLEITPKQVSNLRKCARERLGRWLRKQAC